MALKSNYFSCSHQFNNVQECNDVNIMLFLRYSGEIRRSKQTGPNSAVSGNSVNLQ